ncbi:hypothetical protein D3C85_948560 [compost metagenome]
MGQLHEVRGGDEDQPADQGDQQDGPGDGAARVAGFLGEGAHRIETEEGIAGDGGAAHDQRQLHAFLEEGLERPQRLARIPQHVVHAERDEGQQHEELHQHQHAVDLLRQAQAHHVDGGGHADEGQHPDRLWHRRKGRVQVGRTDQPDGHGQEQVVQQHRPAGEEAQLGVDGLAHVAVGRAGHREGRGHPCITEGGEEHGHGGRDVGRRYQAARGVGEDAEGTEDNDRGHVGDAEKHHRPQRQGALKMSHYRYSELLVVVAEPTSA